MIYMVVGSDSVVGKPDSVLKIIGKYACLSSALKARLNLVCDDYTRQAEELLHYVLMNSPTPGKSWRSKM